MSGVLMSASSRRNRFDWVRKLVAVVLVLSSLTLGIIGLGMVTESGDWRGVLLILLVPLGISLAIKVTPEGGTTGYFDKNI